MRSAAIEEIRDGQTNSNKPKTPDDPAQTRRIQDGCPSFVRDDVEMALAKAEGREKA